MKISDTTDIILRKNNIIEIRENLRGIKTKIILKFDKIIVCNDSFFNFSLYNENRKTKEKIKIIEFNLSSIPHYKNFEDFELHNVSMFTATIKVFKIKQNAEPIIFSFHEKNSYIYNVLNFFLNLKDYIANETVCFVSET